MKLNDLRTLIREEIQNELAEVKKKKKKDEAKKKIMEIIAEAELTEEDLEEANLLKTALGKVKQAVKTEYEEGSVIGDKAVRADAEAKIKAFMDKQENLDDKSKKAYTDTLKGMIDGIVAKANITFKGTPVIVKVEVAKDPKTKISSPILTVGGAKAVRGVGAIFTGSGKTGGQTSWGE